MELQRFQKDTTSRSRTQNQNQHYHSPFTPSALPHESQLCDSHQIRPQQIVGSQLHQINGTSDLAITDYDSIKK
jgi:hypothetical protein